MWDVRYTNYSGLDDGFFSLSKIPEEDDKSRPSTYMIPWTDRVNRQKSSFYNIKEETGLSDGVDFQSVYDAINDGKSDAYSWINVDETCNLPIVKSVPVSSGFKDFPETPSLTDRQSSFRTATAKTTKRDHGDTDGDIESEEFDMNRLYGNHCSILLACFVRVLLIGHNILTVWRVTDVYNENWYWLLVIANFLLIFEGMVVVIRNGGTEYLWWCPCFLIYIASTIPAIWLLQLNQHDRFISSTETPVTGTNEPANGTLDNDVRMIIIEESFVYLLVVGRWLLPRCKLSRDLLAELLIEFLAIASDIMELLAVFDEDEIRGNLQLTCAIMAVWSASFIQFVPVLMQRKRLLKTRMRSPNIACLKRNCGDNFVEMLAACMGIFLQDLPFMVVRLYIIIQVELITYSLIFFLIKNIVTLMFLFYTLVILCYHLPQRKK